MSNWSDALEKDLAKLDALRTWDEQEKEIAVLQERIAKLESVAEAAEPVSQTISGLSAHSSPVKEHEWSRLDDALRAAGYGGGE